MADQIDNLEIRISSSAADAAIKIDRLVSSLGSLNTATVSASKGASKLSNFAKQFARIAKYRFIRSMLKDTAQSFKDLYGWSNLFGTQFAKSMDKITTSSKYVMNSFAAMVSPIVNALAPAFDYLGDRIVTVMNWINQLFAVLSGASTYTVAKKVATTWSSTFDSAGKSAKNAAKEAKRTILAFDEINKLDKPTSGSSGGSGSSPYSDNYELMFLQKKISGGFKGFSDAIAKSLQNTISKIELILGGATAAIGALLVFSGANVPLGLGMLIAGGSWAVNAVVENWDTLSPLVKSAIVAVEGVLAGGQLAIGAILAFSGVNVPLGIGLMLTGTATLGAAVSLKWGTLLTGSVKNVLANIATIVSMATVAVGAVLALSGINVPLGLGLMASGIVGTAVSLRWGTLLEGGVSNVLKNIAAIVSPASLAIGAILALSGANVPLGIGLMAAGIVGTAFSLRWGTLLENGISNVIKNIVAIVSPASLALGAILALTGVNVPLGVALIAAGVTGTAMSIAWGKDVGDGLDTALANLSKKLRIAGTIATVLGVVLLAAGLPGIGIGLLAGGLSAWAVTVDWGGLDEIERRFDTFVGNINRLWGSLSQGWKRLFGFDDTPAANKDDLSIPMTMPSNLNAQGGGANNYSRSNTSSAGRTSNAFSAQNIIESIKAINKLSPVTKIALSAIANVMSKDLKNASGDAFDFIFDEAFKASTAISDASKTIQGIVDGTTTAANWTINQFWSSVDGAFASASPKLVGNSKQVADSVTNIGTQANKADGNVRQAFTNIYNTISSKGNAAHSAVSSAFSGVANTIASKLSSALSSVTTSTSSWSNIGKNIVNGLKNGINNAWSSLTRTVNNLFNGLSSGVKKLLGIRSPSRVFRDEIGLMIGLGMAEGITDSKPMVFQSMEDLNNGLMNGLTPYSGMSGYADAAAYTATAQYEAQRSGQEANNQTTILQAILNVMQEINDKEFTAEITTSSVQRAMNRTNRRAGTTIVPLGT